MTRLYTFAELMLRLQSPDWCVIESNGKLIFMPILYKGKPARQED